MIAQVADYSAEQGILRNNGQPNAIDDILAGTSSAGMSTDDFENYIADFPAGHVQYGGSKDFCAEIDPLRELSIAEAFTVMINAEIAAGNTPDYYDTTPSSQIMQTTIDFNYSGRSWTYQYCTEFGFFQTPSKMHKMRPFQVDVAYWRDLCQTVFPGLDYSQYPTIAYTESVYGGGNKMQGTNIFFTNGSEDPWQWVTQLQDRPEINQRSRVSEC